MTLRDQIDRDRETVRGLSPADRRLMALQWQGMLDELARVGREIEAARWSNQ